MIGVAIAAFAVLAAALLAWRFCASARPFVLIVTPEGRRAWALILLAGGGVAMTFYASGALWIVRDRPTLAFYLGETALILIAIVLTGFAGLLVKRTLEAKGPGGFGFKSIDGDMPPGAIEGAAAGAAAGTVAGAAAAAEADTSEKTT